MGLRWFLLISFAFYAGGTWVGFVMSRATHLKFKTTGKKATIQVHHLTYALGIVCLFLWWPLGIITLPTSFNIMIASSMGLTAGMKAHLRNRL